MKKKNDPEYYLIKLICHNRNLEKDYKLMNDEGL